MSTGSNKSSMRGSVAFPGASFSQAHGAPSFSVQDSSGDDDDEEEVGFPGMASGPSGSISFPGVPDGAGDFVAFPGMGTLQEETEVDYLGEAPTVAETKWGIAKMLVPSLTEPSFDGVAKQLLSASLAIPKQRSPTRTSQML